MNAIAPRLVAAASRTSGAWSSKAVFSNGHGLGVTRQQPQSVDRIMALGKALFLHPRIQNIPGLLHRRRIRREDRTRKNCDEQ